MRKHHSGMLRTFYILLFTSSCLALHRQSLLHSEDIPFRPNQASTEQNANHVFNSIHSSMRQWGSSQQHNGMSFFRANIPQGAIFYHGNNHSDPVTGMEWLAFEVEHAERFAFTTKHPGKPRLIGLEAQHERGMQRRDERSNARRDGGNNPRGKKISDERGDRNGNEIEEDQTEAPREPTYLHIYQTKRRLDNILYIDGMGVATSPLGTLDTQDLVLLETAPRFPGNDTQRGEALCELSRKQGLQVEGFVRDGAGFELLLCNFSSVLDLVSVTKRPPLHRPESIEDRSQMEYARAIASRYDGFAASRIVIDYASMISAYFYPLNFTDPESVTASSLPRLTQSSPSQRNIIRAELWSVFEQPESRKHHYHGPNWQEIVDEVVSHYSDRIQYLASRSTPTYRDFLATIDEMLTPYIDYATDAPDIDAAMKRCASEQLLGKSHDDFTRTDDLIYQAVSTVTTRICASLFEIRSLLLSSERTSILVPSAEPGSKDTQLLPKATSQNPSLDRARPEKEAAFIVRQLASYLDWTSSKRCAHCTVDQVCWTAIWPFGDREDHEHPRCMGNEELSVRWGWGSYWDTFLD